MVKKTVKEDTEQEPPANLRRSTRANRGSIKPVVDLTEANDDSDSEVEVEKEVVEFEEEEEEDEEEEEEFIPETKRKSTVRKSSAAKKEAIKKEPVKRRASTKSAATKLKQRSAEEEGEEVANQVAKIEQMDDDDELDGALYELSEAELKEINHAFNMNRLSEVDEMLNNDGLRTAMRSLGFEPRGDEIKKLIKKFSKKAGKVSRDGFQKIMAFKFGSSPGTKLNNLNDEISRVFNLLDLDKTGLITMENLKSISQELNEELTDDDILEMVQEADLDGDKMINKTEFERIMKKTSLY